MSRRGPAEAGRQGRAALGPVLRWRVVLEGVALAALTAACGPGAYGLANAPIVTRDWHAEDRARDAVANGPEACAPDRLERDRRGSERSRGARAACPDRGLLGIPARGGLPSR
jgi:hypothetical protein